MMRENVNLTSPMQPELRVRSLRSERMNTLVWAGALIWAGLVFMADNIGILERFALPFTNRHLSAWPAILLGAGVLVLIEATVRLMTPDLQNEAGGRLTLSVILIGFGLSSLVGWQITWPLALIAIGASILLGGFLRHS